MTLESTYRPRVAEQKLDLMFWSLVLSMHQIVPPFIIIVWLLPTIRCLMLTEKLLCIDSRLFILRICQSLVITVLCWYIL